MGLPHVIRTWAWRFTLPQGQRRVSFAHMLALRLGSEAVAQLGFLGTVLGDGLRVSLLDAKIESTSVIASVALDRALFILGASVVTALGAVTALLFLPLPHRVAVFAEVGALAIVWPSWPRGSRQSNAFGSFRQRRALPLAFRVWASGPRKD